MGIIGSSWKNEEPSEDEIQQFKNITGEEFYGSKRNLQKRIDTLKQSNWTSRTERKNLIDLESQLNENNEQ